VASLTDVSDETLLARIGAGDPEALAQLYGRHGRAALALAYRVCGEWGLAEEAVQEAFLSVWRRAATYDRARGGARGWLFSVVHNRAVDRLRRRGAPAQPLTDADADGLADTGGPGVWEEVERRLTRGDLERVLAALPPEQRAAIELAYFGGLTAAEIAARAGVPVGTVKGRLRLGLEKMRTLLRSPNAEGADVGLA
jgi:RNA polymerase sigma-70 factor (ECF subfamily)